MLSLKWGDILSMLLPGAVAVFAISPYFPLLSDWIQKIDKPTVGLALLIASALAGGVLEAFTRIVWEPFWLMKRCKAPDTLSNLNPENLDLYERGVQSSYKYVTFYANFAWAMGLLLVGRMQHAATRWSIGTVIIGIVTAILLRASHTQWKYFVNYQSKVFTRRILYVEGRPAKRDNS